MPNNIRIHNTNLIYTQVKSPLYRQIQQEITRQIQQGDYRTGDYLPSENELCRKYGITRTTVRKAMDELQKNGFIERR